MDLCTSVRYVRKATRKEIDSVADSTKLGLAAKTPAQADESIIHEGLKGQNEAEDNGLQHVNYISQAQMTESPNMEISEPFSFPWDPDRLLVHTIRDAVERYGANGITNSVSIRLNSQSPANLDQGTNEPRCW